MVLAILAQSYEAGTFDDLGSTPSTSSGRSRLPPRPRRPRPPRPGDPVDRDELEALVNALIEEARGRARRRRLLCSAVAASVALAGVAVLVVFDRAAQSHPNSAQPVARPGLARASAESKIAFISIPSHRCAQCNFPPGRLNVMNADGSGQRLLKRNVCCDAAWSPDGQKILFSLNGTVVMNADGSGERRLSAGWGAAWSPDGQ